MELLGELLRGNLLHAGRVELVETPQVNREPVGRELRHLIGCLLALVQPIHKVQCYHPAPWRNGNRTCPRRSRPRSSPRERSSSAFCSACCLAHRLSTSAFAPVWR